MKKINIISIIFALLLASCSLDYEPLDTYSDLTEGMSDDSVQVVFKDKAAVLSHRQTLTDLFKNGQEHWYLDMLLLAESHSDNAYAGSPNAETTPFEVNSIEGSNTNLRRDWNGHMGNIAQANKMINNVDLVTDASLTAADLNSGTDSLRGPYSSSHDINSSAIIPVIIKILYICFI
jgi:hypothetical protein